MRHKIIFHLKIFLICGYILMAKSSFSCGGSVAFNLMTNPICVGIAANFTNSSTGNNPNEFLWRWGDGQVTTINNTSGQSHTYAAPGNYTVWLVRVFSNPNCRDSISLSISVGAIPVPSFSFANNGCSNSPIQFNNTTPGSGNIYSWNFGGGINSTAASPSHQFNAYGVSGTQVFPVSLTVTNAAGCSSVLTQNVTVQNRPQGALTGFSSTDCSFSALNPTPSAISVSNVSSFNTNVTNYQINWGDGTANFSSPTFTNTTHTYNSPGSYSILLTLFSPNGCNDTTIYSFYYGSNPSVGLGNPGGTSGCAPVAFSFPVNSALAAANTPGTTYEFIINDGSNPITYTQGSLPASIAHTFTTSSCGINSQGNNNSFQAQLRAINPCDVSTATISPIRISEQADANFTMNPATIACINQVVTLQNTTQAASSVGSFGCDSTVKISWLITPAVGWTVSSGALGIFPVNFNNSTTWGSNTLGVTFNQAGTYQIRMSASGRNCGVDTITQSICVINPTSPSFTLNNNLGCVPFNCSATNNTVAPTCGTNTFNWTVTYAASNTCDNTPSFNFTGGTGASSQNPSFVFNNSGTYTITLAVTNPCGTFNTSQVVTVNRPPQVSINPIAAICAGSNISPTAVVNNCGSLITSYSWSFAGGNPSSSNLQVPPSINFTAPGSFNISLSVANSCGSVNHSQTISVSPLPLVTVNPSNTTICVGQSTSLSASGAASYSWSPSGNLNTSTGSVVVASPTTSTSYTVIGTSTIGCSATATATVNVNQNPVINVVSNPLTICAGQSSTLTASGANSYAWSPSASLSASTGSSVTATPSANTSYTVIGTAVNGCTASTNVAVNVNPLPIVNAGPDLSFCNQNIPQTLTGFNPVGGTWSGSGITSAGVFTPSVAGNGTFTLTYTFTDNNGCTNADNIQVTVSSPTTVNAGNGFSICVSASPLTLSGATPTSGAWSGTGVTGSQFNPSVAGAGTYILTYSVGSGSCLISDTIQVNVLPNPTINITAAPTTICAGQSSTLTASGANSYAWSPSASLSAPTGSSVTATPSANTSYTVIGTAVNGCTASTNVAVNVNPLPIVNAGPDLSFCNQNIPQTLTGFNPVGGTWSGSGVTSAGVFTPSVAGNGTFTLTYTFTDNNGCTNADNIQVIVSSPTTVNAGNGFSACITSPSVTLSGATPTSGTWLGTGVIGSQFIPSVAGVGTYILTYSTGSGSCLVSDTIQVVVNALPSVDIISSQTIICVGDSIQLNGLGALSYDWIGLNNVFLASGTAVTLFPTFNGYIYLEATDVNTCSAQDSIFIQVNPLPFVNVVSNQIYCNQNIPEPILGFSPSGGLWSGIGVNPNPISAPTFNPGLAGIGNFSLIYTFTDVNGCVNSDTMVATVQNPFQADAGPNQTICFSSNSVQLNGNSSLGYWNGIIVDSTGSFIPDTTGFFNMIFSVGAGSCLTQDTMDVIINPLPAVQIGPDLNFCISAQPTALQSNTPGGIWTGIGISNQSSGIFDPAIVGPGSSSLITYEFQSPVTGCLNYDTLLANVHPLPIVSFSMNPIACINSPIQFTNNTAGIN
ncbi:MAG: beta strand repeat-containing protein, partial [Bacteroidota bacterium]